MKFASVSFYCQVSDTGSVGWASSILMLWNLNGSMLYSSTCPLILSNSWIIFFYTIPVYDTAKILSNEGALWSWSYGSWIYNYLQLCLSPLMLWVQTLLRRGVFDKTCDKVCQIFTTGQCFSPGTLVAHASTNKTDRHDLSNIDERGIKHRSPSHRNIPKTGQ